MERQNKSMLEKTAGFGVLAGIITTIVPDQMMYSGYQFENPINMVYIIGAGTLVSLASAAVFAVSQRKNIKHHKITFT